MPHAAIVALFNEARARDYDELFEPLNLLVKDSKARKQSLGTFSTQLQKLRQRLQEIRDIDYFQSSRGDDLQRLLQKASRQNMGYSSSARNRSGRIGLANP